MNDLDNNLPDTRKTTLQDDKPNSISCEAQIKKAVSDAIYKVFPQDLADIKKTLEQYSKAIQSNVLTRFDYFDFDNIDKKMKIIEEIDEAIKTVAYGVKELTDDILYEKNSIEKIAKKWIDKLDERGIKNLDAVEVVGKGINHLKNRMEEIERSKNNIFSITNIFLVVVAEATALNTYSLFFWDK